MLPPEHISVTFIMDGSSVEISQFSPIIKLTSGSFSLHSSRDGKLFIVSDKYFDEVTKVGLTSAEFSTNEDVIIC